MTNRKHALTVLATLAAFEGSSMPPMDTPPGGQPPRGGRPARGGRPVSGAPRCDAPWPEVEAAAGAVLFLADTSSARTPVVSKRVRALKTALARGRKTQIATCIAALDAVLRRTEGHDGRPA